MEQKLCQKFEVQDYPTLKIFYKGKFVADYNGPRDANGIVNHIVNLAAKHPAIKKSSAKQASKNIKTTAKKASKVVKNAIKHSFMDIKKSAEQIRSAAEDTFDSAEIDEI